MVLVIVAAERKEGKEGREEGRSNRAGKVPLPRRHQKDSLSLVEWQKSELL